MLRLKNRIRTGLKSFVNRTTVAKRAYASFRFRRASSFERRGEHYAALGELCAALRHVRDTRITKPHLERVPRVVQAACWQNRALAPHLENRFYRSFLTTPEAERFWRKFRAEPLEDRLRIRYHRADADVGRQGHMIILKPPDEETGERGVILLKYNYTFEAFAVLYDLSAILKRYRVVLEPSWSFNYLPSLFLYLGTGVEGLIQSQHDEDYQFVSRCHPCLKALRLCASDWVDTDLFAPKKGPRTYDIVMVAAWWSTKRHYVLFRALARLRPRRLRVALIGYPMDLTGEDIRRLMRRYGVEDQCESFESIPAECVAEIVADSKVAILLSKQEGNPKAPYEALFCDTPIILHRHNRGLRQSTVNEQTGLWADDRELPAAINHILDHRGEFRPREWALAHSGYRHATRQLNEALKDMAVARGEPWTRDIVPKTNRPNLRYAHDDDRMGMQTAYEDIKRFLRPTLV